MMENNRQGIGMTSRRTRDRLANRLEERGIRDPAVLQQIRDVPRHLFVDEAISSRAYEDTALPIGYGQTISQPFVVARMTEALRQGEPLGRVLEVGTGCGYQTAILAQLASEVYSIERLGVLLESARQRLRELGISNVRFRHGDGYAGWPENAPFDAILVAAAPAEVPQALLKQLAPGGRMVIPVGQAGMQQLRLIELGDDGPEEQVLDMVSFVPLVGGRQ